jgi:hypothetical protein
MANEEVPAYIARCKCGCGGLVFACVDDPKCQDKRRLKDTADSVAEMIREGYAIERMSVGEVRTAKFGCAHK